MAEPETQYFLNTSGGGSNFEAWVSAAPAGASIYQRIMVDMARGFPSRSSATTWARNRIKELKGVTK